MQQCSGKDSWCHITNFSFVSRKVRVAAMQETLTKIAYRFLCALLNIKLVAKINQSIKSLPKN